MITPALGAFILTQKASLSSVFGTMFVFALSCTPAHTTGCMLSTTGTTTPTTTPPETAPPSTTARNLYCPKCVTSKHTGRTSCCGTGGAWYLNCGDPGDSNFDHTWGDGMRACGGKLTMRNNSSNSPTVSVLWRLSLLSAYTICTRHDDVYNNTGRDGPHDGRHDRSNDYSKRPRLS